MMSLRVNGEVPPLETLYGSISGRTSLRSDLISLRYVGVSVFVAGAAVAVSMSAVVDIVTFEGW